MFKKFTTADRDTDDLRCLRLCLDGSDYAATCDKKVKDVFGCRRTVCETATVASAWAQESVTMEHFRVYRRTALGWERVGRPRPSVKGAD